MNYDFYNSFLKGELHHAFILEAPLSYDKMKYAKTVIKDIVCLKGTGKSCNECANCIKMDSGNFGDLYVIEAQKGSIKVSQIEELKKNFDKKPYETDRNICIIKDCDTMNMNGFNRILKMIEEPNKKNMIFLLSENIYKLPETVRSRCIKLKVPKKYELGKKDDGYAQARQMIEYIREKTFFYMKKKLIEDFVTDKQKAYMLLDNMEQIYRDAILGFDKDFQNFSMEYIFECIQFIEIARKEVEDNIRPVFAIKKLVMNIG